MPLLTFVGARPGDRVQPQAEGKVHASVDGEIVHDRPPMKLGALRLLASK
jgi:hypothetical protein